MNLCTNCAQSVYNVVKRYRLIIAIEGLWIKQKLSRQIVINTGHFSVLVFSFVSQVINQTI